ncbi:MAG: ribosome maturation factor RimM [Hyphomicrobiaceae bacterium]
MASPEKRILLGHVSAAHGVRGEMLIKSLTGDPSAIGDYGPLVDEGGGRLFHVKVVRVTPKGVVARITGVDDRNAAEALRGVKLFIDRDQLPPPDDGEFYHADLIGLAAFTPDGSAVGEVVAVQNFGAGDLLEIRLEGAARTEFVPFDKTFTPEVDVRGGRVVVLLPTVDDEQAERPSEDEAPER